MSYSVESHVRQVAEGTVGESHDALHSPHIVPRPAAAGLAVGSQV